MVRVESQQWVHLNRPPHLSSALQILVCLYQRFTWCTVYLMVRFWLKSFVVVFFTIWLFRTIYMLDMLASRWLIVIFTKFLFPVTLWRTYAHVHPVRVMIIFSTATRLTWRYRSPNICKTGTRRCWTKQLLNVWSSTTRFAIAVWAV